MTDSKRQEVADYDNATLYNDYVLSRIAALYERQSTVILYFPDHGEEIYDYRDSKGRVNAQGDQHMRDKLVEYQYQIPFVVWCSDHYISKHPQEVAWLRKNADNTMCIDDIYQFVFRLSRIDY